MDAETRLLLACSQAVLDPNQAEQLARLAALPLDWQQFERLALRHGLAVLACQRLQGYALASVPPEILSRLLDYKTQNAWRTLTLTDELCVLLKALAQEGVSALAYKGPVTAQMLYGDIACRQFNDVDILVRTEDVAQAVKLLERRGYRNKYQLNAWQQQHFLKNDCEYDFHHPETGLRLDLHWNFVPRYFPLRLDLEGFRQRAQTISLNGQTINTFSPEDTLLILSINAAKDYWQRLQSLCDIAGLIRQTPRLDWSRLWQRATRARAQRMLGVSLSLAQELLSAPLPDLIQQKLAADTALPRLTAHIKPILFGPGLPPLTMKSYLLPARALPNRWARLKFYLRFGLQPSFEDWNFVRLPEQLGSFYFLTRPLRLAKKYLVARA